MENEDWQIVPKSIEERIKSANELELIKMFQEPQQSYEQKNWFGNPVVKSKKKMISQQLSKLAGLRSNPAFKRLAQFSQSHQLREVRRENEEILDRINNIISSKQQGQESKNELKKLVLELQNNYSATEQQLYNSNILIDQLKGENTNLKAMLTRAQQQQRGHKSNMSTIEMNLESLKSECEKKLSVERNINAQLSAELLSKAQNKEPQSALPRKQIKQISDMKTNIEALKSELNAVRIENKEHKKNLKICNSDLTAVKNELSVLESDYQNTEETFIQNQTRRTKIEQQSKRMREALDKERIKYATDIEQFKALAQDMAEKFQTRIGELEVALALAKAS
jgi:chromosome segregation ATPase